MAKTVRIPLAEPILGHGDPIREIILREPTYDEYVSCGGEPYTIGQSEDGVLFSVEKPDVIWAYAQACMIKPTDTLLLSQADWRVSREVRKAVLGFFQVPAVGSAPSPTSPTTSSSDSISPSTPSGA